MSHSGISGQVRRTWRPHWRGLVVVTLLGAATLGVALYVRYGVVEPSEIGLACESGGLSGVCIARRVFVGIFSNNGFSIVALIATGLALLRPNIVMVVVALVAGLLGVVLYNTGLSALALSLLPLVLARSAPQPEFQPE